ncbi:MAG: general secretion pathway protein GspC [Myxococcales bacterium]|nr:MAG: general secretion pathway protein GspC [Myxococcales bacterium]
MALDALLKRYFLGVVLALVAVAAYFQAAGATQLIGSAIGAAAPSGSAAPIPNPPYRLPVPTREPKSGEPIIARNPFDSVTGPLNAKPVDPLNDPGKPVEPELVDPLAAPACDGIQVLIVTESDDPLWSVAALQGPGEPHPRMRRVGDDVAGKKVAFIGFNPLEQTPAVWIESGAQVCQAMLFRTQPPVAAAAPTPAAPAPEPPKPASGAPSLDPAIASKIQKVSDTEFNIDRSVIDKIMENQAELMKSARIVPEQKDGKVVGVRLFGIRPDTLLGTLGLQNGDRLETLNGFNMASPEKALEAYARLRTASNLNVKVNRRGAPVSIDLHIK